ncbi:hypothetical protein [Pelagibacterium lacus]|uniref:Uncharacterized protein n=1 Tax=Pelagibacterium lacus TaxID=2282655 RepID=A0A369WAE6_9HYPH|nr:hypothetical protein [Pelagibacterium lacus]RDE10350.1 hypothetical protein DVH29_02895 [Pelagibacterium lacus]
MNMVQDISTRAVNDNDDRDDTPTGAGCPRLPADALEAKRAAEAVVIATAKAAISARPRGGRYRAPAPKPSRHPDFAEMLPALAWFYGALDANPLPLGEAANDNDRPMSVPDVNPRPMKAETLLRALPTPTRVSVVSVRRGGKQVSPARRVPHWARPAGSEYWGAFRISTRSRRLQQVVRVNGVDEFREYSVPAGTVTHVWGERVGQDAGRAREPENEKYITEAESSRQWFCDWLDCQPGRNIPKSLKRRKFTGPIDWDRFRFARGNVPFHLARELCGLPPATMCPPALPWRPEHPRELFAGMLTGRGSRADGAGTASRVKRPRDDTQEAGDHVLDRLAIDVFAEREPEEYGVLLAMKAAGSMGALVASNDNATGKRAALKAAAALSAFWLENISAA